MAFDLSVEVGEGASISCRFYIGHKEWPWILFFHGNGEVVSDYDEVSPFYHQEKMNMVVADYRGYGVSSGIPTLTDLVRDAHVIFKEVRERTLQKKSPKRPVGDGKVSGKYLCPGAGLPLSGGDERTHH